MLPFFGYSSEIGALGFLRGRKEAQVIRIYGRKNHIKSLSREIDVGLCIANIYWGGFVVAIEAAQGIAQGS